MKKAFLAISLIITLLQIYGQGKDLDIYQMRRGNCYAHSTIVDSAALGGFGGSNNYPFKISDTFNFIENGFFLKIDSSKIISIANNYNGYFLYLVNKSDSILRLKASDSRLYIIAEAFIDKTWQPIEYLPNSWCGNSYHTLFLQPREYWKFEIPKFTGKVSTKIRYRLLLGNGTYLYSNEILAKINKKQLKQKEGHKATSLMDPYND